MKRRLVIEYDTDAPREECGKCPLLIEYSDDWATGEPVRPDCGGYLDADGDPVELVNDDDTPLRCTQCLASEDRWIPVGERLPLPGRIVLVGTKYDGPDIAVWNGHEFCTECPTICHATRWRELPEDPEHDRT